MAVVEAGVRENLKEEEQKGEGKERKLGQQSSATTTTRRALEALEALHLQMEPLNAGARRAFFRLRRKLVQVRRQQQERRGQAIQGLPGFWTKAILNHPQMSTMISEDDEDMLSYMVSLEVEKLIYPKNSCKIVFFFRNNPYFQNEVIIKEYDINITGYTATHSTPIQWSRNYEHEAYSRRHHDTSLNFFNWFSGPNCSGYNRIAEIIIGDLWLNPVQYYQREGRGREKK